MKRHLLPIICDALITIDGFVVELDACMSSRI